ncbi:uncharacterized protein ARMOST_00016 [Armillaria ostoyae]|uniref:3-isopropylmalate dehydratase n=1 Tax=Armillaria ostoyae TaxID=47428 RepID=A0A284QJY5_ARMOS|nr:uncharacterized protein ARMOST_00016 [Armillaria ostoyae]
MRHSPGSSTRKNLTTIESFIEEPDSRAQCMALEDNAKEFGLTYFGMKDKCQGIVHVIGPEQGFTLPGITCVCGDSHTSKVNKEREMPNPTSTQSYYVIPPVLFHEPPAALTFTSDFKLGHYMKIPHGRCSVLTLMTAVDPFVERKLAEGAVFGGDFVGLDRTECLRKWNQESDGTRCQEQALQKPKEDMPRALFSSTFIVVSSIQSVDLQEQWCLYHLTELRDQILDGRDVIDQLCHTLCWVSEEWNHELA